MSKYLTVDDIRSTLIDGFDIDDYLAETDMEIEDLAERLGITDTDDISTPLTYKIKRYAVVYTLMRIAQDKIGKNDPSVTGMEKYMAQYDIYKKELEDLRPYITYEMMTGNVTQIVDRVRTVSLYRG